MKGLFKIFIGVIAICVIADLLGFGDNLNENSDSTSIISETSEELNSAEENILQALYTACKSNQVMGGEYNLAGVYTGGNYTKFVDLSSVEILDVSDIYTSNTEGNNVDFCVIEVQFHTFTHNYMSGFDIFSDNNTSDTWTRSEEPVTKSFALMLSDGWHSGHNAYAGMVDNSWSMQDLEEFSSYLKKFGIKKKFSLYTIDREKMNRLWMSLCESLGNQIDTYKSLLEYLDEKYPGTEYIHREYYVSDINNDDIAELIYCAATSSNDMEYYVYTYLNHNSRYCGTIHAGTKIENEEQIKKVSNEAVYAASKEGDSLYLSYGYSDYQYICRVQLDQEYIVQTSSYYDSKKENESVTEYHYPGTVLASCDFSDSSLLEQVLNSIEDGETVSKDADIILSEESEEDIPVSEVSDQTAQNLTTHKSYYYLPDYLGKSIREIVNLLGEPCQIESRFLYGYGSGIDTAYAYKNGDVIFITLFDSEENYSFDDRDAKVNYIYICNGFIDENIKARMSYNEINEFYSLDNYSYSELENCYMATAEFVRNGCNCVLLLKSHDGDKNAPVDEMLLIAPDVYN